MKRIGILLILVLLSSNLFAETVRDQLLKLGFGVVDEKFLAPDFKLKNLDGKNTRLRSYKGNLIFLNFWATWCGPCRAEMPSMQTLYSELQEEGLVIVAVNRQEGARIVKSFINAYELTFPVLLDTTGQVSVRYGAASIVPLTYLLDRDMNIIARVMGAREWDTPEMLSVFRRLLEEGYYQD